MHYVKCLYCDRTFDADKERYVKPNKTRYAHIECYELVQEKEQYKSQLIHYIQDLFKMPKVTSIIYKQINSYLEDPQYGYTYQGILNSLKYFYEVKKGDVSKANNRLGIVPYVYDEAQEYFENINSTNEKNKQIMSQMNSYNTETIDITIPSPQRVERKRNLFTFLDEE